MIEAGISIDEFRKIISTLIIILIIFTYKRVGLRYINEADQI